MEIICPGEHCGKKISIDQYTYDNFDLMGVQCKHCLTSPSKFKCPKCDKDLFIDAQKYSRVHAGGQKCKWCNSTFTLHTDVGGNVTNAVLDK